MTSVCIFLYLKQLRHENLVNLIEVFRRKKRLYLVFEFVDHTILDDLEKHPTGLDEETVQRILWQVLKGVEFCHLHNVSFARSFSGNNLRCAATCVMPFVYFRIAFNLFRFVPPFLTIRTSSD